MSNTEKPVKLDIPFQNAIRFLAKHEPKQTDSQAEETEWTE